MDFPQVEPIDGREIDRLITALLNVTGVLHRIIAETPAFETHGHEADGPTVMTQAAARTRALLAQVVEHHDDEELSYLRHFLAVVTVVLADDIGTLHLFQPPHG